MPGQQLSPQEQAAYQAHVSRLIQQNAPAGPIAAGGMPPAAPPMPMSATPSDPRIPLGSPPPDFKGMPPSMTPSAPPAPGQAPQGANMLDFIRNLLGMSPTPGPAGGGQGLPAQ
jgi:hypothetical protein